MPRVIPTPEQRAWIGLDPTGVAMSRQEAIEQGLRAQLLDALVEAARRAPGGSLPIRDERGAIVATVTAHQLPVRPTDMQRKFRPKQKLSKRQRAAARRVKSP